MKHGILIMAHNNVEVVRTAIKMLDDSRFCIILHVDKKSPIQPNKFVPKLKYAKHCIMPQMNANWGGYSFINCMLRMFEVAINENVDYIHVLQGADLPLKTPDEIDIYMEKNQGVNFLRFIPEADKFIKYKLFCKHFFVDNRFYRKNKFCKGLNYIIAHAQEPFIQKQEKIYHGSSLFSITFDFAKYVLEQEKIIHKKYKFSLAGDEYFLHTIFMNSPYIDTLYGENALRLIDWERREGNSPHTFTMEDEETIKKAIEQEDCLFARKFDEKRDIEIVRRIEDLIKVY